MTRTDMEVARREDRTAVALILARSGSKGIPRKNIQDLGGLPLMAYPIHAARRSRWIRRVIVSTDDPGFAAIARAHGAETPFLRPKELAGDREPLHTPVHHACAELRREEGRAPGPVVILLPTYPFLKTETIDRAIEKIRRGAFGVGAAVETEFQRYHSFLVDGPALRPIRFRSRARRWYYASGALSVRRFIPMAGPLSDPPEVRAKRADRYLAKLRNLGYRVDHDAWITLDWLESLDIDTPEDLSLARKVLEHGLGPGALS